MKSDSSFLMNHKILLPNRCREGLQGLKSPVFTGFFRPLELFPLIFRILLLLIYALNIIPNGNFDTGFLLIILFIKIFVAEEVAKSLAK